MPKTIRIAKKVPAKKVPAKKVPAKKVPAKKIPYEIRNANLKLLSEIGNLSGLTKSIKAIPSTTLNFQTNVGGLLKINEAFMTTIPAGMDFSKYSPLIDFSKLDFSTSLGRSLTPLAAEAKVVPAGIDVSQLLSATSPVMSHITNGLLKSLDTRSFTATIPSTFNFTTLIDATNPAFAELNKNVAFIGSSKYAFLNRVADNIDMTRLLGDVTANVKSLDISSSLNADSLISNLVNDKAVQDLVEEIERGFAETSVSTSADLDDENPSSVLTDLESHGLIEASVVTVALLLLIHFIILPIMTTLAVAATDGTIDLGQFLYEFGLQMQGHPVVQSLEFWSFIVAVGGGAVGLPTRIRKKYKNQTRVDEGYAEFERKLGRQALED